MQQPPDVLDGADVPQDEENEDRSESNARRAKRIRARRVLLGGFLFIIVSLGLYAIWPWLLPAFIYEGPMLQLAGETEVTLVWYLTRPVSGDLAVHVETDDEAAFPVERTGRRCRAILTGLRPGQAYRYEILLGKRALAQHQLRTSKPAGEPFSFIVFGDSGKATAEQYLLADQMGASDPDFVLHTGDLIYSQGERRHYKNRFFEPYRGLVSRVPFWPSIGNHDVFEPVDESPYFEIFELPENGPPELPPEHEYWFDYASARILIVDSEREEAALRDQVAPWLRTVLAQTDAMWKFVVFHRPPYTAGAHAPSEEIQRTLVPVFEDTGVDLVFNGHDHMYERTHPIRNDAVAENGDGVVYVVSGAGGAMLYQALPPDQRPPYLAALNNEIHSFTKVSVNGTELSLEQIGLDGRVLDEWTVHKPSD